VWSGSRILAHEWVFRKLNVKVVLDVGKSLGHWLVPVTS
jgi:hypothetical protein